MATRKAFARGATQVLYRHLPYALFEHDDYGLSQVESVALADSEMNRDALFDALSDALAQWRNPTFNEKFPDPRDPGRRSQYVVGAPREVRFSPYPLTFVCRKCSRVASYAALAKHGGPLGVCQCGGSFTRMRYVQAHNCGRMEELKLPERKCPNGHGPEHNAFYDPGRVRQARWYCKVCNADLQGLRMTPCRCAYSASLGPGDAKHEKWLKVVPAGDPSLYMPHTLSFVNFPEDEEGRIRNAKDALGLMLARAWGLLDAPVHTTVEVRSRGVSDGEDALLAQMAEQLRVTNPDSPVLKAYDARKASPPGQSALDKVTTLLNGSGWSANEVPRRWLVEHTTLQDRTSLSDTTAVATMLRNRGDERGAKQVEDAARKSSELMGIASIRVINDFPLALCAFGYTRIARDPARTVISPFPPDERGKIPIYALASETEALWFQLDPVRVAAWLIDNGLMAGKAPQTAEQAWAWVYTNLRGLRQSPTEPLYNEPASAAVRTLIHTMSHVFLRRIEWSGFSPSSVGEYLLTGTLSFILYANRHAETKIGGLTTLFEQRLGTWLWDAVQSGQECIYDPLCGDDGGSCAGCTHREHNCLFFNRDLSRSMLYGGPTPQNSELAAISIRHGYWAQAWQAAPTE